jgi:hypothetical protein
MLAITHHVIVKSAAIRVGIKDFRDYCVLGDDIIIADDKVAEEYLNLMSTLGLKVNRQKSVESFRFSEFAKNLIGYNNIDYTPIGAGLILQTIRSKSFCLKYTMDLVDKGLVSLLYLQQFFKSAPK